MLEKQDKLGKCRGQSRAAMVDGQEVKESPAENYRVKGKDSLNGKRYRKKNFIYIYIYIYIINESLLYSTGKSTQ